VNNLTTNTVTEQGVWQTRQEIRKIYVDDESEIKLSHH
jgi:hypothetical protein